jgi:CRP/FNR family transcriptional regulator, cyclic AMP receptor protein
MAELIKLSANDVLLKQGENSQHMYWLQSGQLVVTKKEGSRSIILGHIYKGELVGELSFLDSEPRSATVQAETDCELIKIPQDTLDKILAEQPKWLGILIRTLAERLRKANARIRV